MKTHCIIARFMKGEWRYKVTLALGFEALPGKVREMCNVPFEGTKEECEKELLILKGGDDA